MTCLEMIAEVFAGEPSALSANEVIERLYANHPERPFPENTIRVHLAGLCVNGGSAESQPSLQRRAFLWRVGPGRYRRWDPEHDGPAHERATRDDADDLLGDEQVEALTGAIDTSVSLERDLERALLQNLGQLEAGLTLFRGEGLSGQQLDTGVVGRIDIVAVDKDGGFVVIELKAGKTNDRVIGQILRYMGWVAENLADGKPVRGMIVADEFDDAVRYAAKAMPTVSLQRYQIRFSFEEV